MASPITSNPALNLIMAARDASAGPSGTGAASTFSDMLERNMRQSDQAATRPRETAATPARPASAEPARSAPARESGTKPVTRDARSTADNPAAENQAAENRAAVAGTQGNVEDAANGDPANQADTSSALDDATTPAAPTETPDVLLTATPAPDPADNETAVAASLAALAPVLAGIAIAPEPDAAATDAELATPARTLASTLMARLFGHPGGGDGKATGADASAAGAAKLAAPAVGADDAPTEFAALMASKQPAATPAAARVADPALNLPGVPAQLAAEPGTAGLLHTAGATGAGVARTESTSLQQLPVATAVGQRAWAEDVGTKLTWMVGRGESRAELVLTPPSMGKLGVSIHINGDQTTAHFVAATPAAREALEQAMPRLREMLQQSGINLGQADVSTSGQHQAREDAAPHRSPYPHGIANAAGHDDAPLPLASSSHWIRSGAGVIDTFA